jgi:hypothetical protein
VDRSAVFRTHLENFFERFSPGNKIAVRTHVATANDFSHVFSLLPLVRMCRVGRESVSPLEVPLSQVAAKCLIRLSRQPFQPWLGSFLMCSSGNCSWVRTISVDSPRSWNSTVTRVTREIQSGSSDGFFSQAQV